MKITLRPRFYSQALAHRLAADPVLAEGLGAESNAAVGFLFRKFFDAEGPLLGRLLDLAQGNDGEKLDFLSDLQFSAREVAAASHLEVVCRKTVAQSDAETRATLADYEADALQASAGGWCVRLPKRVYLGRSVPPEAIAHVDQYTGEYVLGRDAAQALRASALRGWTLQPVLHWKSREPLPGVGLHLQTDGLLPLALKSATTFCRFEDGPRRPPTPRRYGALAYAADALASSCDFARTAEPWCDWSTPQWVVRQSVRAWYGQAGLRGWAFRPVLVEGSALHAGHETRWEAVLARLRDAGASVAA